MQRDVNEKTVLFFICGRFCGVGLKMFFFCVRTYEKFVFKGFFNIFFKRINYTDVDKYEKNVDHLKIIIPEKFQFARENVVIL